MNRLIFVAMLAGLASCTTYKLWSEADSDQEQGVVRLSYEYRNFESPQVDERAGIETARERCRNWGYQDAQRKGEDRQCTSGAKSDCGKWLVIREYRCTSGR